MTTIAAIQGDGWVVIGADSQSTVADYRVLKMAGEKVYENNGLLIGGAGMGRGLDLMHKGWEAPKPTRKIKTTEELDHWMVYGFMPAVRQLFIESGYDMKDPGTFASHESAFLVAVNGICYFIDDDYSVDRDDRRIMSVGSGSDYATGALYAQGKRIFRSIEAATKALTIAVNAAKEYDVYSGGETRIYIQTT